MASGKVDGDRGRIPEGAAAINVVGPLRPNR
jgi:hypothetical protein